MVQEERPKNFKETVWTVIFEAETPAGKLFDVVLLWLIAASVLVVMLETVASVNERFGSEILLAEWTFTVLFSVEYVVRLAVSRRPWRYASSFFALVDLLSCLPLYLSLLFGGTKVLAVVRILRLLRMFRILKMVHHLQGARVILKGLIGAAPKITVFFSVVLFLCTLLGTLLYLLEGGEPGTDFTSIPVSIYYAIVSVTTVGYGDITVTTDLGRLLTSVMILSGFAIIAVPTGIVVGELGKAERDVNPPRSSCSKCGASRHESDARFCRCCGHSLP